ncbi:DNA repair protein RadA [Candidatus Aerophobetes bacterium]|nr:DNA repair protein RadA [Candidatus Aerophobetes bacterium]
MGSKTRFVCQKCGYVSLKWMGRCPECGEWGSLYEESIKEEKSSSPLAISIPKTIDEIKTSPKKYYYSGISEFDRILGGGIVPGSLILIGGEPGIGKSTLLLEVVNKLSYLKHPILYVSGEESAEQTKLRALRLGVDSSFLYILPETNLEIILQQIDKLKPRVVAIDSIQTAYLEDLTPIPGSITQIRECTAHLMKVAKKENITIFLVGHVTKEGAIAGPRVLEHMVDTVLYFESSRDYQYRVLRAVKNRFGPTSEIGIFKMEKDGLKEVVDSSRLFLRDSFLDTNIPGAVIVPTVEGSRVFLVEIQALVSNSNLAVPRRITQGVDYNRICLLLAVLEKKGKFHFFNKDVYINVAGGMRVDEPACDLAIALSIISSLTNKPVPTRSAALGEIGLAGEIRPVGFIEKRLKEAIKLGFTRCLLPSSELQKLKRNKELSKIELIGVGRIGEALRKGLKEN